VPRQHIHLIGFLLAALLAFAATGGRVRAEPAWRGAGLQERVLRVTEYFDTMLPGVLEENNITLHFTPKFSDLRDSEYIRYPLELRYGATDRVELSAGLMPFSPNPINSGRDHRWGPGEGKLAGRYDIGGLVPFFDDTTLGLETRVPLGNPPAKLNDHFTHVKPFVSTGRKLRMWPDVLFYTNLSYDRSVELTHRDAPPAEVMRRNIIELAPGLLFKPGEFGTFAEYHWRHLAEETEWRCAHEVRLGGIWDVPLERSRKWNLPGKWQLELAYKFSQEEGRSRDQGVSVRVNWRTTLREVFAHTSAKK
jgi:hypothetical protein